jgi:hypothetical protein
MAYERWIARAFRMDEQTWRRHANPWSVWTRAAILPLLVLSIWSRTWIGWWALVPITILILWIFINPRAFPPPRSTDNWASKAVLGEQVWLNRGRISLARHHRLVPHVLSLVSLLGVLVLAWGLVRLEPCPTIAGTLAAFLAKMWFVDRMVWLYEQTETPDENRRGD